MMNAKAIGYWVSLVLFSAAMGFGGVADLMKNPEIMDSLKKLGYPEYVALILGFLENLWRNSDSRTRNWAGEGVGLRGILL